MRASAGLPGAYSATTSWWSCGAPSCAPPDQARAAAAGVGLAGGMGSMTPGSVLPEGVDMEKYVADIERSLLLAALAQSNGVQTRAADVLKISYRSFRHLVKKYGL